MSARGVWFAYSGNPNLRLPFSAPPASRAARAVRSTSNRALRAPSSKVSPASVSSTPCLVRQKSGTPSSCSSFRICWLKAGCDRYIRPAARPKFASSATATKYLSCLSSIPGLIVLHVTRRSKRAYARLISRNHSISKAYGGRRKTYWTAAGAESRFGA